MKITLFILMLVLLSMSALAQYSSDDIQVTVSPTETFIDRWLLALKNVGRVQQTIILVEKEFIVGQRHSISFNFKPICQAGTSIQATVVITTPESRIYTEDISNKVTCNSRRNLLIRYIPQVEGQYQIAYGVINKVTNKPIPIETGDVETDREVHKDGFESVWLTAKRPTPGFKPGCDEANAATRQIFDGGKEVGEKKEVKCYSAPGVFRERVIVTCIDGYERIVTGDFLTTTCKKEETPPHLPRPPKSTCGRFPFVCDPGETPQTCPSDCTQVTPDECNNPGEVLETLPCNDAAGTTIILSRCMADPTGNKIIQIDSRCPPCSTNTNCASGFVCYGGTCATPATPPEEPGVIGMLSKIITENPVLTIISVVLIIAVIVVIRQRRG